MNASVVCTGQSLDRFNTVENFSIEMEVESVICASHQTAAVPSASSRQCWLTCDALIMFNISRKEKIPMRESALSRLIAPKSFCGTGLVDVSCGWFGAWLGLVG
jgi:hypothetical protein